jgi:hypothetical protein
MPPTTSTKNLSKLATGPSRSYLSTNKNKAAPPKQIDLLVRREDETIGWAVNVSSAEVRKLFSIPVQASYLAAVQMAA